MPDDRAEPSAEVILETAIGGAYQMPDDRKFWIDGPVAREIVRRILESGAIAAFAAQAVQRERERCAQIAKRQATNANGLRPSEWTACAEFIAGAICVFGEDAAMEDKP